MARNEQLQKKLDSKWWYRLGKVILWLIVILSFFAPKFSNEKISAEAWIIDGTTAAILNLIILVIIGKIIIYVVYGKDIKSEHQPGISGANIFKGVMVAILLFLILIIFIGIWGTTK